jgi:hypothetical protein
MAARMEIPPLNIGSPCDCLLAQLHGHCRGVGGFVVDVLDVFLLLLVPKSQQYVLLKSTCFLLKIYILDGRNRHHTTSCCFNFHAEVPFSTAQKTICLLAFHPIVLQKK